MGQNSVSQLDWRVFESTISLEQNDEIGWFFASRYKFMEIKSW